MKNWLVFLLGFIAGIVFTIFAAVIIAANNNNRDNGMTFFEQPGETFKLDRFEIMQTLGEGNYALAQGKVKYQYQETDWLSGEKYDVVSYKDSKFVLIINDNGEYYYDEQVIDVPKGKSVQQVGIYRYINKSEDMKTVPIVKLMDE